MAVAGAGWIESPGVARVRAALDATPLVVVRGPMGAGKSTAIALATRDRGATAWYSAESWERDAFIEPLIARVRDVRADAGRRALALAEEGAAAERIGAMLGAELAAAPHPLVLVIDDAQHLDGGAFDAFFGALVRYAPELRAVVATRTRPEPALVEALAAGRATLVDEEVLRFDGATARALARELGRDPEAAEQLAVRADGWPLAIALAVRLGSDRIDAELLGDVLATRFLATLAPEDRAALEATAIYETVEPALFAPSDAGALGAAFERLLAAGALVVRVPGGYRVHPVVRETILDGLRRRDPPALAAQHAVAALGLAERRRFAAVAHHLALARRPDADRIFLRFHATDAIADRHVEAVRLAAARLRRASDGDGALLALIEAFIARTRGEDPGPPAERALALAEEEGDARVAFLARLEALQADLGRGRFVAPERVDVLLAAASVMPAADRARAIVRGAWADVLAGRFEVARAAVDRLPDDDAVLSDAAPLAAYASLALGDLDDAQARLDRLLERLAGTDAVAPLARTLGWSARFAALRGAYVQARDEARESLRITASLQTRDDVAAIHGTLADAAAHTGEPALVRSAADAAMRTADRAWYVHDARRLRARAARGLARAAFLEGDDAGALAATSALDEGPPAERAAALADAALYAALRSGARAATAADRARSALATVAIADALDAVTAAEAAELVALVDAFAGRPAETVAIAPFAPLLAQRARLPRPEHVGAALRDVADEGGRNRVLAALAPALASGPRFGLIAVLALAGEGAQHLEPLLALFPGLPRVARLARRPAASGEVPVESLTAREREILALLAAGLANREIAERMVVGTRTVETHVANILAKLGVPSRTRAVARAIALGLVEPPREV